MTVIAQLALEVTPLETCSESGVHKPNDSLAICMSSAATHSLNLHVAKMS
jgi:hypothetical protein